MASNDAMGRSSSPFSKKMSFNLEIDSLGAPQFGLFTSCRRSRSRDTLLESCRHAVVREKKDRLVEIKIIGLSSLSQLRVYTTQSIDIVRYS
jgi:hypothetical protein